MLLAKLNRLDSQVLLEVLSEELVFRTPYFNSVRELMNIIQRLNALLSKDCASKIHETYVLKDGALNPLSSGNISFSP